MRRGVSDKRRLAGALDGLVLLEPELGQQLIEVGSQHGPGRVPQFLVVAVLAAACGARQPGPSSTTRATVERAEAAELRRDHATARKLYQQAIAAAPDATSEAYARRELAETLLHWGEVEAGATELEAVVRLDPKNAPAWHDLGLIRHNLDDDAGAVVALTHARDLAPRDQRPRIALAALYWKLGDKRKALVEYQALAKLELPARLREKVQWAIAQLSAPAAPQGP